MEETWELAAVMSEKDEIEVSAGGKGIAVKAKGSAATRIGHSFADALRFFASPLGLAADEVDRFRIYRQVAFEQTLLKAHDIVLERGIETSNTPLKFLAQWGEAASLEDMDDPENLSDLYANLLVSESSGADPNALLYVDMLKKMNKVHIQFLNSLLGGPYQTAVGNPAITFGQFSIESILTEPFELDEKTTISEIPETELLNQISVANDMPGVEVLVVSTKTYGGSMTYPQENFWFEWIREQDADCEGDQPDLIFSSLAALELVDLLSGNVTVLNGVDIRYTASILTPLGWDFLRACNIEELK